MAIRQERFIAQINASVEFWRALKSALAQCKSHRSYVQEGRMTPAEALDSLCNLSEELLVRDYATHISTITTEYNHFSRNALRNEKRAEQQESKRRLAGMRPMRHAYSLIETTEIAPPIISTASTGRRRFHPLIPPASHVPIPEDRNLDYSPMTPEEHKKLTAQIEQAKHPPSNPPNPEPNPEPPSNHPNTEGLFPDETEDTNIDLSNWQPNKP